MGGWTAGASVSRADYTQPFTLRWWKKVLVLCFSQITFRADIAYVCLIPSGDLFICANDLFV